jgi:hypothetical protein
VPAGSGRESGQWTSGNGGSSGGSQGRLPPNRHIDIFHVRRVDEARSGVTFDGLVSDAQYTRVPSRPIITPEKIEEILRKHGAIAPSEKGRFTDEFATEEKIKELIEEAWAKATLLDVAAGRWRNRVVIRRFDVSDEHRYWRKNALYYRNLRNP